MNFLLCANISEAESSYKLQNYQKHNILIGTLEDNEVLVVFSSIVDKQKQIVYYVAKIYRKGNKTTKVYNLCSEGQLVGCIDNEKCFYNDIKVSELIWKPIEEELQTTDTIYYVPCGLLTDISLEYCMDINGKRFYENYNIYRLSSSSVLSNHSMKRNKKRVSIWGGIDFYADLPRITEHECVDIMSVSKCNMYLADSYKAAVLINDELQQQGICSEFYFDNAATEERFKSQKWNNIDILFIETHGLFLDDYNISNINNKEDPMENHALALAGANYVLDGGIVPDSIDDGILTAREISELDLRNIDLAIISACKSAIGEIREDGVYGLMSGFKQAGVKSLIMTTDNIVDYVSGQLWVQFFHNMSEGMTKREALLEGLKYIMTMDGGTFSHPKYWTPFILIDGLE